MLSRDKSKQAKEALAELEKGPQSKTSLEKSRAGELRDLLFTFGGFNLTKAALDRFLSMGEVRRLLDDDLVKTRQEMIDATTATAMLQAAITRSRRAAVKTSLIELVWRCRFVQKCVLESA